MNLNPWGDNRPYNSYANFFKKRFGHRLQKLCVDAGFSCPNRDPDDRSRGGCTFCNNNAFTPSYCNPSKSITQQLDEGILFHQRRYRKAPAYLAYFQPYSNTFAPLPHLQRVYSEALAHPLVAGLIISTRPDCVDDEKLDYIASLSEKTFVAVEYGIESCNDDTLRTINRRHTFATSRKAIEMTAARGIHCGAHMIVGLPGESPQSILDQASIINTLPIDTLKLHQLQILNGTQLCTAPHPAQMSLEEYIGLVCDFLERLRPDIMMQRFAGEVPPPYQAEPQRAWRRTDGKHLRNQEIPALVEAELNRRNTHQGSKYSDQ